MVPGVRTSPAALWAAASTYLALAGTSLRRQLTYRAANLAGLITNLFFGALRAYVLIALFGAREQVAGYSVRDAVTYSGITQALMSCVAIFGWWDMIRSIRTGEVATDLSRPVDYFMVLVRSGLRPWRRPAGLAGTASGGPLRAGIPDHVASDALALAGAAHLAAARALRELRLALPRQPDGLLDS